jgi:NAD(P)-dependent dehydrogenase (short-subunit alcohol dehydrogenase family)
MNFSGKVAFVAGGTSGIGKETGWQFARAGAAVLLTGTNAEAGKAIAGEMQAQGLQARFHRCDVSAELEVKQAVEATLDRFGRLDFAVNSAGIYQYGTQTVAEIDSATWDRILAVNLTGTFYCMKYQIAAMLRDGGGSVVNIASGAGLKPVPFAAAYVASKHGVIGLTKNAALEYAGRNIRANVICPGLVKTGMTAFLDDAPAEVVEAYVKANPMERIGLPEEQASAALWLCTPGAAFTTGIVMPVDGGFSMR